MYYFYIINLRNEIMYYAPASANINLPPTERQGIEVSAKWQANSSISMEGGYGYTDARFISGTIGGVSVAGGQIPLVSRHKATAAANWMIGEHTSLILRTTYSGEARLDNDQENKSTLRRPAFFVADFLLLHQIEQWRFRFGINNLTDERYFTYGILGSGANPYNAYPAMRRSLLATAERSF
jgi:iron complex outermembrane receptor protein